MERLIDDVKNFVQHMVIRSIKYYNKNNIYPRELIQIMKSMNLFGLIIPKIYNGLEFNLIKRLDILKELSYGWIYLAFILDNHLRVCDYIIHYGTNKQKQIYLPLLSKGLLIANHINYQENFNQSLLIIQNSSEEFILSGIIQCKTNEIYADLFAISVYLIENDNSNKKFYILIIDKNLSKLKIEDDINKNCKLIIFDNYLIEKENFIGEFNFDGKLIIKSFENIFSIIKSSILIGILKKFIENFSQIKFLIKFDAANSLFNDCSLNINSIDQRKIFSCELFLIEILKELSLENFELFNNLSDFLLYNNEKLNYIQLNNSNPSSIILDYIDFVLPNIKRQYILDTTLEEKETIRNIDYYSNKNLKLYLYDMTTLNPSRTFKDLIACLTFVYCLQNNIHCFCAQSSGNTAMSLIHYAQKHPSIKVIQFYLTKNSYKINSIYLPSNVILIEIDSIESEMKRIVKYFSQLTGIPYLPNYDLQFKANEIRSHFIKDYSIKNKISFNWYVQSLSSAFGPIGLYQGFKSIENDILIPKFLGIQQEAICPFARQLGFYNEINNNIQIIEPTLFRSDPGDLILKVKNILDTYGGKIKVLTNDHFYKYLNKTIDILSLNNIHISKTFDGNILEKAGILALAATLHEIDQDNHGSFQDYDHILIGITGGTACPAIDKPIPKLILNHNPTDEQLKLILTFIL